MTEQTRPVLRVVRGEPTPEELAVITVVVSAAAAGPPSGARAAGREPVRGRWNDPAWGHRRPMRAGPGAWRSAAR